MPSLSLGGTPLLYDVGQRVTDWIDQWIPSQQWSHCPFPVEERRGAITAGHTTGLPIYPWRDAPPPRINEIYWPSGATRWATGWFLTTGDNATKIGGRRGTQTLTFAPEDLDAWSAELFLLDPIQLAEFDDYVGDLAAPISGPGDRKQLADHGVLRA